MLGSGEDLHHHLLDRVGGLIENLVVYPENLKKNLDRTGGLWASEGILLSLVNSGMARQEAYVFVQRNAMKAFHGEGSFRELLKADEEISKRLSDKQIDEQFDLDHALSHADHIIDRVLQEAGLK